MWFFDLPIRVVMSGNSLAIGSFFRVDAVFCFGSRTTLCFRHNLFSTTTISPFFAVELLLAVGATSLSNLVTGSFDKFFTFFFSSGDHLATSQL